MTGQQNVSFQVGWPGDQLSTLATGSCFSTRRLLAARSSLWQETCPSRTSNDFTHAAWRVCHTSQHQATIKRKTHRLTHRRPRVPTNLEVTGQKRGPNHLFPPPSPPSSIQFHIIHQNNNFVSSQPLIEFKSRSNTLRAISIIIIILRDIGHRLRAS